MFVKALLPRSASISHSISHLRPVALRTAQLALAVLLTLLVSAPAFSQKTIRIPADQPTIQAGINAAATGDTVLVAPGTYFENLVIDAKQITLISETGAAKTILDGASKGSVIIIQNTRSLATTVNGFTLQAGLGGFTNSTNSAGGIHVLYAGATLINNVFAANAGVQLTVRNGSALIANNTLTSTPFPGPPCDPTRNGWDVIQLAGLSTILDAQGTPIPNQVVNNTITGADRTCGGLGIRANDVGYVIIESNIIHDNRFGISVYTDRLVLRNNLVYNNFASALYIGRTASTPPSTNPADIAIVNNTFVNNYSSPQRDPGSAEFFLTGTLPKLAFINNIIVGSSPVPIFTCYPNDVGYTPVIFDHNDISSVTGPITAPFCNFASPAGSFGNISAVPSFVSATDFHLKAGSPGIDTGNNSAPNLPATDLASAPRIQDSTGNGYPVVDMGAYESSGLQNAPVATLALTSSAYYLAPGTITLTAALTATSPASRIVSLFQDGKLISSGTLTPAATFSAPVALTRPGLYSFTATLDPTGSSGPAVSVVLYVYVTQPTSTATTTTLTSSLNSATISRPVTFTAQVTSTTGTPTGSIAFVDGTTNILNIPLTGNTATLTTSSLTTGTHNIAAVYLPTSSFAGSSATLTQTVTGLPTNTSLAVSPAPAFAGQAVTFASTVTPTGSTTIPTGTVTFYNAARVLGTATLDAAGNATFITNSLTPGTLSVYALYAGDTTYATSTSTILTENIQPNPTATTVTITPSPGTAYQYVTVTVQVKSLTAVPLSAQPCVPSCTVNFNIQGLPASIPAISSLSIPASGSATTQFALPAGSYTLRATFNGNGTFLSSSAAPITETILPAPSALTLAAAPGTVYQSQPITFTASLTALPSIEITSGTITFLDGTTPIGTAPFNANLLAASTSAIFSTSALAPGTHTITAIFPGNADFLPSSSATVAVTITPQDFAVTPAAPTLTLQTQHHLTTSINLTSLGAFADTLTFNCANLPAYASCKFTPGSLQILPNGTATASLYIETSAVTGYASRLTQPRPGRPTPPIALALLLSPATLLLGAATRRRRNTSLRLLLLLLALLPIPLALTGCSGKYPGATPPGTYTIGITAAASATHITHTAQMKLVVTE